MRISRFERIALADAIQNLLPFRVLLSVPLRGGTIARAMSEAAAANPFKAMGWRLRDCK